MGTKYPGVSISGYNASPPADDGSATEANKTKWATIKTKITDPIKTLAEAIDAALTSAFDYSAVSKTANYTVVAADHMKTIECNGTFTVTLGAASSLGAGYTVRIKNAGTGEITVDGNGSETIDGDLTIQLVASQSTTLQVNSATGGWNIIQKTSGYDLWADDASGTDTITATFSPAVSLTDGITVQVRAAGANTTTTPTFNANSTGAKTITKNGDQALVAGDIHGADHVMLLQYNSGTDKWELLNPSVDNRIDKLADGTETKKISPDAVATWGGMSLGDGSDGALTYSVTQSLASGFYFGTSLDVQSGVTINPSDANYAFLIFIIQGTATITGTIDMDGHGSPGGAAGVASDGGGGQRGFLGGAGGGGGVAGFDGGTGGGGLYWCVGGAGTSDNQAGQAVTTNKADHLFYTLGLASLTTHHNASMGFQGFNFTGGGGGGGGGSNDTNPGGVGGAGGGTIIIIADEIVFTGTVTADGSSGTATVRGDGGSGGGGCALLLCRTLTTNTGTISADAGADVGDGGVGGAGIAKVSELPI